MNEDVREEALAAFEQEMLGVQLMTQKEQQTPTEWTERAEKHRADRSAWLNDGRMGVGRSSPHG